MSDHDYYLSNINTSNKPSDQELEVGKLKRKILERILSDQRDYSFFYPLKEDLRDLPNRSTLLKISFILKKSYMSKGEGEFNIIHGRIFENPIVRDTFLGCPTVRPSSWKGHLRFAAEKVEWEEKERRKIIRRLFGSEHEEENLLKGRLHFFSTFFREDAEKDVITPLNRKTRTPVEERAPINLEVIKPGKSGEFYLLYIPYPEGEAFSANDIQADLNFLAEALQLMFYTYGFSAKKTSGFGVVREKLNEGKIWVKLDTGIDERELSKLDELKNKLNEFRWLSNG